MGRVALPDGHVALPDGQGALADGQGRCRMDGVAGWSRDQEKMLPEKPGDPPWGEKKESPSSTTVLRRHGNGRNSRRNADE